MLHSQGDLCQVDLHNYLEILKNQDRSEDAELFLDIELMLAQNAALSHLFTHFTKRNLHISENQDVSLELDLNFQGDREFIQQLPGILYFQVHES